MHAMCPVPFGLGYHGPIFIRCDIASSCFLSLLHTSLATRPPCMCVCRWRRATAPDSEGREKSNYRGEVIMLSSRPRPVSAAADTSERSYLCLCRPGRRHLLRLPSLLFLPKPIRVVDASLGSARSFGRSREGPFPKRRRAKRGRPAAAIWLLLPSSPPLTYCAVVWPLRVHGRTEEGGGSHRHLGRPRCSVFPCVGQPTTADVGREHVKATLLPPPQGEGTR